MEKINNIVIVGQLWVQVTRFMTKFTVKIAMIFEVDDYWKALLRTHRSQVILLRINYEKNEK